MYNTDFGPPFGRLGEGGVGEAIGVEGEENMHTYKGLPCASCSFQKILSEVSLKVPPSTRFATNFLVIDHLLKLKQILNNVVLDVEWQVFVDKMWDRPKEHRPHWKARIVEDDIESDDFWEDCNKFVMVVGLCHRCLQHKRIEPLFLIIHPLCSHRH